MKTIINDNFKNDDELQLTKREIVIRNYNPWKAIFFMCLPTVIIMIIMSTYNLIDKFLALQFADSYVISTFLENNPLIEQNNLQMLARNIINVATQYSSSTIGLLTAFSLFIAIGTSTRFGIAYGERNNPLISQIIGNGISLMIIVAIVLTPILVFTNEPLIALQSKNSQMTNPAVYKITLQLAVGYTKWFIFFLFFVLLSNFLINLLRTEGQGFWATIIIFTSVIVNVVLDIVLMVYGKLGLEGAAVATVISWFWNIIFALLVIYLDPKSKLKIYWEDLKIEKTILYNIVAIGMTPLFINISVAVTSALSNFFVSMLSSELPRPGFTVPWVVQLFAGIAPWIALTDSPLIGVSQGGRALLSYSYGAKDYQRIWDILKRIILVQFLILIITELIIGIFGNEMLSLFISNVDMTYRWYFLLSYLVYPTVVVPYIGIIFYQSISRPKMSLFFSALRSIIVFIPCIVIGYFVALTTKNAHYYFLFLGLVAPISALISIPILIMTWKKYRSYLKLDSAKKWGRVVQYSQSYLKNNPVINLDNVITINPEVIRASNSHIKEVNYAHLKGTIIYNSQVNSLIIDVQVTVTITLLCALSLQPFSWTNEWNWKDEYGFDYFNCNLNYINEKIFYLDKYLWDEIFAITPINLTVKNVKICRKGKKWQFITEKEVYNSLEQDSRWMPLKKLKLESIKEDK